MRQTAAARHFFEYQESLDSDPGKSDAPYDRFYCRFWCRAWLHRRVREELPDVGGGGAFYTADPGGSRVPRYSFILIKKERAA